MKGRRIGRFAVYRLRGETIVVRLGNSPVNSADPPSLTRFNGTVVNGGGRGPLKKKKKKKKGKTKKSNEYTQEFGIPGIVRGRHREEAEPGFEAGNCSAVIAAALPGHRPPRNDT